MAGNSIPAASTQPQRRADEVRKFVTDQSGQITISISNRQELLDTQNGYTLVANPSTTFLEGLSDPNRYQTIMIEIMGFTGIKLLKGRLIEHVWVGFFIEYAIVSGQTLQSKYDRSSHNLWVKSDSELLLNAYQAPWQTTMKTATRAQVQAAMATTSQNPPNFDYLLGRGPTSLGLQPASVNNPFPNRGFGASPSPSKLPTQDSAQKDPNPITPQQSTQATPIATLPNDRANAYATINKLITAKNYKDKADIPQAIDDSKQVLVIRAPHIFEGILRVSSDTHSREPVFNMDITEADGTIRTRKVLPATDAVHFKKPETTTTSSN